MVNGGGGKAMFIDTENTFRPARLVQIAQRFGIDEDTALDNVLHIRCHTSEEQFECLGMFILDSNI